MSIKLTIVSALAALLLVSLVGSTAVADNRLRTNGHWDRTSDEWPAHLTFVDYTGAPWPVGRSSVDWDVPNNIDVDYLDAGSGSCGHHCVPVRSTLPRDDPFGILTPGCTNDPWQVYGYSYGPVNANNHFIDSEDVVRFNRDCADRGDAFRRALTCQELGHALGLGHADVTSSCMYSDPNYAATRPRDHDLYYMLSERIYDH